MTQEQFDRIQEAAERVLNRMDTKNETIGEAVEAVLPDYEGVSSRQVARALGHSLDCPCSLCGCFGSYPDPDARYDSRMNGD